MDALQFWPDRQVAGAVPDPAEIPSLASHVAERSDRQKLRDSLSVDRPDLRNPLPPRGQVAGYLRPEQREDTGRLLGAVCLSVYPEEGRVAAARSSRTSAERPWALLHLFASLRRGQGPS